MASETVPIKDVLKLIRSHADGNENDFTEAALEIAKELKNDELAGYIYAQFGMIPTFSPDQGLNDYSKIQFAAMFELSTEQVNAANFDMIFAEKRKRDLDLGMSITRGKEWVEYQQGTLTIYKKQLFVFTREELKQYAAQIRKQI